MRAAIVRVFDADNDEEASDRPDTPRAGANSESTTGTMSPAAVSTCPSVSGMRKMAVTSASDDGVVSLAMAASSLAAVAASDSARDPRYDTYTKSPPKDMVAGNGAVPFRMATDTTFV